MVETSVHVEVEVNPTESEQKVREAVENIFGPMKMETRPLRKGSLLVAEAKGQEALFRFRDLLKREQIRTAARTALLGGIEKTSVSFCLNKQVAFVRHVSFSNEIGESPLGPLKVKITCNDPKEVVSWLTTMSG